MLRIERHSATDTHGHRRTKDCKALGVKAERSSDFVQFLSVCVCGQVKKTFEIVLFSMTTLAAMSGAAQAALLGDTLKPFASVTQSYDSNIFRIKDREQLRAQTGDDRMADFITVLTAGTKVHYQVSGQTLDLLLKRDYSLYSHYSNQDSNRDLINGNLALSVFDKLKITLEGNYAQAPQSRSDYRGTQINEQRELTGGVAVGYEMTMGVGLAAAYRHTNVDYSLPQFRANEYAYDLYAATVSYRVSPDTRFYGTLQREYRDYPTNMLLGPTQVNNSNVSDSIRIGLKRTVGSKTAVSGYVGYLERRHDQGSGRDFDGVIGQAEIIYNWSPRLALTLNGERQLYEETYADRIYSVNDSFGVGLKYQVSSKVKASVSEKLTWKSFKDVPGAGVAGRSDWLQDMSAGIEWAALNRLKVSLGYQYSTRDSDDPALSFSAHIIQSGITYSF